MPSDNPGMSAVTWSLEARDRQARAGWLDTPHGRIPTPVFMPVGTRAAVRAVDSTDLARAGADILLANTYHLMLRPGVRADRRSRRSPPLHGVGEADPHRLGRIPDLLPRPSDRRTGCPVPLGIRRLGGRADPRGRRQDPGGARAGHRHGTRCVRRSARAPGPGRGGGGAHVALGGALPAGTHPCRPSAVRHRPGWGRSRPQSKERGTDRRSRFPRLWDRRALGWRVGPGAGNRIGGELRRATRGQAALCDGFG